MGGEGGAFYDLLRLLSYLIDESLLLLAPVGGLACNKSSADDGDDSNDDSDIPVVVLYC